MRAEACPDSAEASLLLCGDRRIRTLNRTWRHKDSATDVLAFPQLETSPRGRVRFDHAAGNSSDTILLGDVVISVQTARKQAASNRTSLQQELRFLLVHGILHLLGWNDDTPAKRARMLTRQKEILAEL